MSTINSSTAIHINVIFILPAAGFAKIFYFGMVDKNYVMVMDLLGLSLEDLFDMCSRRFSVYTVMEIARQIFHLVSIIHSKGLLHRDIKPENFLIGRSSNHFEDIYMVDFGLSKEYIDPTTHKHVPFREHKSLTGTARYMSINTHLAREQSRRDDLEAVCYVLIYFLRAPLPWQGLKADNLKDRYNNICQVKRDTSIEALCDGLPREFPAALKYCKELEFGQDPDYGYLNMLFESYIRKNYKDPKPSCDWVHIMKSKRISCESISTNSFRTALQSENPKV
ncbi:Casein kinase I isoform gamma-1 [Thelohanellus kitauei]|uniref:non-specific serine/threonine protein kinase n=1 Tax=Thelohanellus kitauei TaxID=669202 RepID=A0A0C2N916_THEKT|nr:Casein kinase I isoform gamma-1 [Thelohanellus kitauei]